MYYNFFVGKKQTESLTQTSNEFSCDSPGCRIFIVGGVSSTENKVLSDVECYDVEGDYWLDDVEPIESPALGLVCLTIRADPEPIT